MTIQNVWDDPNRQWPSIAYIETTNFCNATCKSCLNHRCERERGIMTFDTFARITDILVKNHVRIGAMFCFGEPLIDNTIELKFSYARARGVLMPQVGFNTNVSLLTEERFKSLIDNTPNITLSFFNTGKEYEDLTGLDWSNSYKNATEFIKFRDSYKPSYKIFIGCNTVKGYSLENVKNAFAGYNVEYVQDAELRWGGAVITGVIDRMMMYNSWRCDGFKGALQIKYNGDCEFCAYDIIGSKQGGETKFGNILIDDFSELRKRFVDKWNEPCSLCKRCDYFHHAYDVINNNFKKPDPLPPNWYDWQKPYISNDKTED